MRFPPGTVAENVTLVWTGPGDYPGPLPAGVTVTRDSSVWYAARTAWLQRHGFDSG
jgi:streptogramin lyase